MSRMQHGDQIIGHPPRAPKVRTEYDAMYMVLITCIRCLKFWSWNGDPIRGQFQPIDVSSAVHRWTETSGFRLIGVRRWFHHCPNCDEELFYEQAKLEY